MNLWKRLQIKYNETFRKAEIQAILKSIKYEAGEEGKLDLIYEFPSVAILADEMARFFDAAGGKNYVEISMYDRASHRKFTMTVQRHGGETPGQKASRLEAELEQLKKVAS